MDHIREDEPTAPTPLLGALTARGWAIGSAWDKRGPAPEIPHDFVEVTRARYVDAYERLTGRSW